MEKDYYIIVNNFDEVDSNLTEEGYTSPASLKSKIYEISEKSLKGGFRAERKSQIEDEQTNFFNKCETLINEEILKSSYQNSLDKVELINITAVFEYIELPSNEYVYEYRIEKSNENNADPIYPIYSIESIIDSNIIDVNIISEKTTIDPYDIDNAETCLYNIFKEVKEETVINRLGHLKGITSNNENIYYLSGTHQNIQFIPKNSSIIHNGVFVYKEGDNTAKKINYDSSTNKCSLNPQTQNLLPCESINNGYDVTSDIAVKINMSGFSKEERYIKQGNPVIICDEDLINLDKKHLSYNKNDDIINIVDNVNEDTTINFLDSSENPYTTKIENNSIKILNGEVNNRNIQIEFDNNKEDSLYKIVNGNSSLVFKGKTLNLSDSEFYRMFGINISDIKVGFSKKINNIKYGPITSTGDFSSVYNQKALYFDGDINNTTPSIVPVPGRSGYDVQQEQEKTLSMVIKNIELIRIGDRLIKINYPKYVENI